MIEGANSMVLVYLSTYYVDDKFPLLHGKTIIGLDHLYANCFTDVVLASSLNFPRLSHRRLWECYNLSPVGMIKDAKDLDEEVYDVQVELDSGHDVVLRRHTSHDHLGVEDDEGWETRKK